MPADEISFGDTFLYYAEDEAERLAIEPPPTTITTVYQYDTGEWFRYDFGEEEWVLDSRDHIEYEIESSGSTQNTTSGTLADVAGTGPGSVMGFSAPAGALVKCSALIPFDFGGTLSAPQVTVVGPAGSTVRALHVTANVQGNVVGATVAGVLAALTGSNGNVMRLEADVKLAGTAGIVKLQHAVTALANPSLTLGADWSCTFKIVP
jgi:hypothetical protein